MHRTILLIYCLICGSLSYSQEKPELFPDNYLGVYRGTMEIFTPQEKMEIPMALSKDQIDFEIQSANLDQKTITGEESGFEIFGFPLSGIQKANLIKTSIR